MKRFLSIVLCLMMVLGTTFSVVAEERVAWPEQPEEMTLTLFADIPWLNYEILDGVIAQWIKEETGITIEMTKATDNNQLVLMVASGDIPYDLVCTDSDTMFREMADESLCFPYDELIAQYVPNWEVPVVEQNMNKQYATDGHYYMLKNNFDTVEDLSATDGYAVNTNGFYFRRDIFDTLGIAEIPTTFDGVMEMLDAVQEKYPEMTPMVFMARNYNAFANFVGLDVDFPTDANGKLVHKLSAAAFKDFYASINKMYREGYIKDENFSFNSDEQMYQYMTDGSGFMFSGFGMDEGTFDKYVKNSNPNAALELMPLLDNYARTISVTGWAGCYITKNCKNPEAAIKLISWLKDGDNQYGSCAGVKDVDWTWGEDGKFTLLDPFKKVAAETDVDAYYNTGICFLLNAGGYIAGSSVSYANASDNVKAICDEAAARSNWSNVIGLATPDSGSDEAIIKSNLTDLENEYFPIVCMSKTDEEFEANFAKMMEEAEKIGIEQYNEWYAAKYAELCETFGGK